MNQDTKDITKVLEDNFDKLIQSDERSLENFDKLIRSNEKNLKDITRALEDNFDKLIQSDERSLENFDKLIRLNEKNLKDITRVLEDKVDELIQSNKRTPKERAIEFSINLVRDVVLVGLVAAILSSFAADWLFDWYKEDQIPTTAEQIILSVEGKEIIYSMKAGRPELERDLPHLSKGSEVTLRVDRVSTNKDEEFSGNELRCSWKVSAKGGMLDNIDTDLCETNIETTSEGNSIQRVRVDIEKDGESNFTIPQITLEFQIDS